MGKELNETKVEIGTIYLDPPVKVALERYLESGPYRDVAQLIHIVNESNGQLDINDANRILAYLGDQPYKDVFILIQRMTIRKQIEQGD